MSNRLNPAVALSAKVQLQLSQWAFALILQLALMLDLDLTAADLEGLQVVIDQSNSSEGRYKEGRQKDDLKAGERAVVRGTISCGVRVTSTQGLGSPELDVSMRLLRGLSQYATQTKKLSQSDTRKVNAALALIPVAKDYKADAELAAFSQFHALAKSVQGALHKLPEIPSDALLYVRASQAKKACRTYSTSDKGMNPAMRGLSKAQHAIEKGNPYLFGIRKTAFAKLSKATQKELAKHGVTFDLQPEPKVNPAKAKLTESNGKAAAGREAAMTDQRAAYAAAKARNAKRAAEKAAETKSA